MKTRIITAIVLLCVFIPMLILSDTVVFTAFISLVSLIAVFEYLRCLGFDKNYAVSVPAYLLSLVLPFSAEFKNDFGFVLITAAVLSVYLFYLFAYAVFKRGVLHYSSVASAAASDPTAGSAEISAVSSVLVSSSGVDASFVKLTIV